MAQERIKGSPRELSFYGEGKAGSINLGFAITSIRNPRNDYAFTRGEKILANCVDDGEKVPVIVIANDTKILKDHSIGVLALDGFFSPRDAAQEMKVYPGYENTTVESSLQAIVFVTEETFMKLDPSLRKELLAQPIDTSLRKKEFRHIFFPTMANHLTGYGAGVDDWADFLYMSASLITAKEYDAMSNYEVRGTNMSEMLKRHQQIFKQLTTNTSNSLFKPLVLGIFED